MLGVISTQQGIYWDNQNYTHRIEVEGHRATLHGIYDGPTPSQRSFQCVVGGIDHCFAFWVLECEVGMNKPVRLRKHQKMATLDQDQKKILLLAHFQNRKSQSGCVRLQVPRNKQIPQGDLAPARASPNYTLCQFPVCDVG